MTIHYTVFKCKKKNLSDGVVIAEVTFTGEMSPVEIDDDAATLLNFLNGHISDEVIQALFLKLAHQIAFGNNTAASPGTNPDFEKWWAANSVDYSKDACHMSEYHMAKMVWDAAIKTKGE